MISLSVHQNFKRVLGFAVVIAGLSACGGAQSSTECSDSSTCAAGFLCVDNQCVQACFASEECGVAAFCLEGLCRNAECSVDADCQTPNACHTKTDAQCLNNRCIYPPLADTTACDDGNPCTEQESCSQGNCAGTLRSCDTPPASHCDDTDSFYITYPATGTCDPGQGECEYPPTQVACTNCAQTCLSACAGLLCPDQNGGCKSQGICDPESVTCQYTTSADGAACDLPDAAVGSHGGTCLTGVCNATSYVWESANWGACSTSCGSGTQSRTVVCRRSSDNTAVADSYCTGTKPTTVQTCEGTTGCSFVWTTSSWSACSMTCGTGTQTRVVECHRTSDNAVMPDSSCTTTKPSVSQSCNETTGCSYAWQTGTWSTCSTTCGTGNQTRAVVCKRSNDNITVADANCTTSKPTTTQSCTDNSGCAPSCIVNAEGRANQHWAAQLSSTNATTCTFSIDGAAAAVIPAGCNFPLTEDTGAVFTPGNHVLTVYATGAAGSTSCTDTFVILPRPTCTFSMTSPAPGSVTYNVASTDTTSCTVTINGGAPSTLDPCTFTRTDTGVGAGYYVLVISVVGPGGDNTCSDDITVVN